MEPAAHEIRADPSSGFGKLARSDAAKIAAGIAGLLALALLVAVALYALISAGMSANGLWRLHRTY